MPKYYFALIDNGLQLVHRSYTGSMLRAVHYLTRKHANFDAVFVELSYFDPMQAMNGVTNAFMESDCHKLVIVDGDQAFEPWHLEALLSHDVPIVFGAYCKKHRGVDLAVQWIDGVNPCVPGSQPLVAAARAPRGFMAARRDVFEIMGEGRPTYPNPMTGRDEIAYWQRDIGYSSEDYWFCDRWREKGGIVWVDQRVMIDHLGWVSFPMEDEKETINREAKAHGLASR